MPGFGHAGLAGSVGLGRSGVRLSFGFVHNRLADPNGARSAVFAGLHALMLGAMPRRPQARLRDDPAFGAPYDVPRPLAL